MASSANPRPLPKIPGTNLTYKEAWKRNGILAETRISTLFLCTNLFNNKLFVAKTVMAHDLETRTALEIERRMYKGYKPIDSPYIIRYLGFNIEKGCKEMDNNEVCNMFLEWVPRGSLYQYIHNHESALPETAVCTFSKDILRGLSSLHAQGKVHGDIKASNVLMGKENLKLCDLGSGKVLEDGDVAIPPRKGCDLTSRRIYTTGSDGFRAPEVEDETDQGPAADIYAFGCTLVEMATGEPPQRCPRIFQAPVNDLDPETGYRRCTIDLPANFSDEAFKVLELCLAEYPRERPSADALLRHPWFTKFDSKYPSVPSSPTRRESQPRRESRIVDLDCSTRM